eukprot:PhF_6_TR36180/c0_g1_i2/m.52715
MNFSDDNSSDSISDIPHTPGPSDSIQSPRFLSATIPALTSTITTATTTKPIVEEPKQQLSSPRSSNAVSPTTSFRVRFHFVRHAVSESNVATDQTIGLNILDPTLCDLGQMQVKRARSCWDDLPVGIVITSPLTRTLETAVGIWGNGKTTEEGETIPIFAYEEAREVVDHHPSDWRRSRHEYIAAYPEVNFSHVAEAEDMIHKNGGENKHNFRQRVQKLLTILVNTAKTLAAKSKTSAVGTDVVLVSHYHPLMALWRMLFPNEKDTFWENMAMRSFVMESSNG